ncbi:MAG: hypothetical protein ACI4SG_06480 [Oligosphaeraceae bacterium]
MEEENAPNPVPEKPAILLLGMGTAGSRAAFYLYQRGALDAQSILAVDSDAPQLEALRTLQCLQVPPPPALPAGAAAQNAREALEQGLAPRLEGCQMLLVVTCLGGATGDFYTQAVLLLARQRGIPAVTIAALPHAFDSRELQEQAAQTLGVLQAQHFEVLTLNCGRLGQFFPDARRENAYAQAVRWIAETAIGFVTLFTLPRVDAPGSPNSLDHPKGMDFDEMPRGIFAGLRPAIWEQQKNLDVPTYLRLHLSLPLNKDNQRS